VPLLQAVKDLLFPPRCLACDKQLGRYRLPLLCNTCRPLLSPVVSPLCPCCGTPFPAGEDHLCGECLGDGFAFDYARSIFLYREPVSSLLVQFKFGGKLTGLVTLAELTKQAAGENLFKEPDLVLPVPLHIKRLRSRGFNQSLLLARSCFPKWQGKIRTDLLLRHQPTIPQTSLSGRARRNNLKGAFSIHRPEEIAGRNILLVDDVFTSGSTLHECAKTLAKAGAARIETFTLARAL
jgi:ComF family protein